MLPSCVLRINISPYPASLCIQWHWNFLFVYHFVWQKVQGWWLRSVCSDSHKSGKASPFRLHPVRKCVSLWEEEATTMISTGHPLLNEAMSWIFTWLEGSDHHSKHLTMCKHLYLQSKSSHLTEEETPQECRTQMQSRLGVPSVCHPQHLSLSFKQSMIYTHSMPNWRKRQMSGNKSLPLHSIEFCCFNCCCLFCFQGIFLCFSS